MPARDEKTGTDYAGPKRTERPAREQTGRKPRQGPGPLHGKRSLTPSVYLRSRNWVGGQGRAGWQI